MQKLLSIGTIVLLKNGQKRLMIYGRLQSDANTGQMFDYVGCLYPEGNISHEYTYLFNQGDIENIYFEGFVDEEEEKFQDVIQDARSRQNKN